MTPGTIEQLNFNVILNTKQFDEGIKAVEERAKNFNTSLSQSLDIQKSVEKVMNATAKASAKAAAERAKEAQSFGKYVEQLRKMEEEGKRMAEQMPKAFNWSHHINQTYLELNRVMEVLQKIKERQESGARIQYSTEYLNKITAEGEGALRAITALEQAQKRLTAKDNGFQEHIRNLTSTNVTLLQMREHYAALEKDTARAAKETEKMYSSQTKSTKEAQKQLPIGRSAESLAAERAAIEKRIAENLANENKELNKLKTAEGTRASQSKRVEEAQKRVNKLIEDAVKQQKRHADEVQRTSNHLASARSIMSTISQLTGIYFGAAGIRRFVSSLLEITSQFEFQRMAMRNILQDVEGAERIFQQLYEFSSSSTYRFSELAKYAKQLAAFGIGQDNILDTTKRLGDVASGLGISMDRLITAYGHVKSSGFLRGIQLRSFSQNGVPILEELSKILTEIEGKTVSIGSVFDRMSKREIDFSMVEEAFRRMTSEGGKFNNTQEVMAQTLGGQINILKGRWENLMYAMGQQTEGFWMYFIKAISGSISSLDQFKESLRDLTDAGSPLWAAIHALQDLIRDYDRWQARRGKGGEMPQGGGAGASGGGQGGGSRGNTPSGEMPIWAKTVRNTLYRLDPDAVKRAGLEVRSDEDYFDYLERIGKEFKEINEQKDKAMTADKPKYEAWLRAIREVDKALEGNILMDVRYNRTPWNGGSGSKTPKLSPEQKAWVAMMEETEDWLEKDFFKQLENNTKQLEKDYKTREKAQEDYEKLFREWSGKDFGKHGVGAAFDISSDIAEYNNKNDAAQRKYEKALALVQIAHKGNAAAIKKEREELKKLLAAEKEMNKAEFVDKVRGRADSVFKEAMQGFDLTDWNDKTLAQILAIRKAIKNVKIPPEIAKDLEGQTEAAEQLLEAFNKLKQDTLERTVSPEMFKKVSNEAGRIAGYLGTAASKMRDFADATGDTRLAETAEFVGILAQNMQAAAEGAKSWGGWWGAIIGGVTDLIDQVTTGLTEAARTARELENAVRDIRGEAFLLSQTSMFSQNGIFGTNGAQNMRGAVEAMKTIREHMEAIGDPEVRRNWSFWEKMSIGWRMVYNRNHIAQEELPNQGRLSDVMARYGLNVYDQYGNLDANSIREVIKLFGDEDGVLEQLAKDSEAYAEAMKVVESVAESLVGGVVGDLTDKIVDSWWEAGQAALDYADILGDVAKAYAKLIVNDMLLQAAFDPERQEAFKDALRNGDTARAMSIVEGAMQSAVDMLPAINSALQVLEPYRNPSTGGGESGASSLGSGIKSITEETAGLLASYINAIRADVSYIRSMYENGFEGISAIGQSLPTLNEYLAQVSANTYDTAQNTNRILSELQSVIGAPGTSGMVVRVENA